MKRSDWLLLLIAKSGDCGLTPIQVQKGLFLLSQNASSYLDSDFYDFEPYDYGPFDSKIYSDVEALTLNGELASVRPAGQRWPQHIVTTRGGERAALLQPALHPNVNSYMDQLVAWLKSVSFRQLLHAIYKAYPDFAKNSVFRS